MKEKIIELILRDDLKGAALLLGGNAAINQAGRVYQLEKSIHTGIITHAEATRTRNQIRNAILSEAGISEKDISRASQQQANQMTHEALLSAIIMQNRRRRPGIASEAEFILSQVRAHHDKKLKEPSFDPVGRRYAIIVAKIEKLQQDLQEAKGDSLESIVEQINSLISETIPTYENLKEAYRLASGRGMSDSQVETILTNQPNDSEARITVAEKIDYFLASISAK